nr:bifunctional 3-dehydroquinate dehydratase/shikimate dehydrogenase, chloroplastic-like [Tanacetum cinerariifolium]
ALPIEQLDTHCPKNGMILANCSAIGMEPDIHLTPVSKVHSLSICVCDLSVMFVKIDLPDPPAFART